MVNGGKKGFRANTKNFIRYGHNKNELHAAEKTIDEMSRPENLAKPRISQSFSLETAMSFPPLSKEDGAKSPMIIEVEMGGHFVIGKIGDESTLHFRLENFMVIRRHGNVTGSRIILWNVLVLRPSIKPPAVNQSTERKTNIAIHPELPEQDSGHRSTLTEKGAQRIYVPCSTKLGYFCMEAMICRASPQYIGNTVLISEGYSQSGKEKRQARKEIM
ncbi:hypothetical protein Tco_0937167 [Tanacetum coccineum]|uniref:Uncharacterized protein n=1 Tax=Tanacetum coccineum TaxID=301880 RepID=A0ABQ5DEC2_9ASTR